MWNSTWRSGTKTRSNCCWLLVISKTDEAALHPIWNHITFVYVISYWCHWAFSTVWGWITSLPLWLVDGRWQGEWRECTWSRTRSTFQTVEKRVEKTHIDHFTLVLWLHRPPPPSQRSNKIDLPLLLLCDVCTDGEASRRALNWLRERVLFKKKTKTLQSSSACPHSPA